MDFRPPLSFRGCSYTPHLPATTPATYQPYPVARCCSSSRLFHGACPCPCLQAGVVVCRGWTRRMPWESSASGDVNISPAIHDRYRGAAGGGALPRCQCMRWNWRTTATGWRTASSSADGLVLSDGGPRPFAPDDGCKK